MRLTSGRIDTLYSQHQAIQNVIPLIVVNSIFLKIPLNSNNTWPLLLTLFVLIVLSEAVVMNAMDWGGPGRSLLDSLLMNSASAAVGYVLLTLWPSVFSPLQNVMLVPSRLEPRSLLFFSTTSVLVECSVLLLLRRHSAPHAALVSVVANLVSCILLAFGVPLLISK